MVCSHQPQSFRCCPTDPHRPHLGGRLCAYVHVCMCMCEQARRVASPCHSPGASTVGWHRDHTVVVVDMTLDKVNNQQVFLKDGSRVDSSEHQTAVIFWWSCSRNNLGRGGGGGETKYRLGLFVFGRVAALQKIWLVCCPSWSP